MLIPNLTNLLFAVYTADAHNDPLNNTMSLYFNRIYRCNFTWRAGFFVDLASNNAGIVASLDRPPPGQALGDLSIVFFCLSLFFSGRRKRPVTAD